MDYSPHKDWLLTSLLNTTRNGWRIEEAFVTLTINRAPISNTHQSMKTGLNASSIDIQNCQVLLYELLMHPELKLPPPKQYPISLMNYDASSMSTISRQKAHIIWIKVGSLLAKFKQWNVSSILQFLNTPKQSQRIRNGRHQSSAFAWIERQYLRWSFSQQKTLKFNGFPHALQGIGGLLVIQKIGRPMSMF